jgi:acylaminoacyl-peptidase
MAALRVPLCFRVWMIAADGSGAVPASEGIGAHIWPHGAPVWTPDGEGLIAAGGLGDSGALLAYDRRSGERRVLMRADAVFGLLQFLADGRTFIAVASTPRTPSMVVRGGLTGAALTPVFDANEWLADVATASVQPVRFAATDGQEISGWLVAPVAAAAPPPDVHYGPNAAWGPAFAFGAQVLAGRGIATLLLNPRGSTGYGDAFAAAADFGGADFADLQTGLDTLIASGTIDGARLGIMGLSYGGFMASWAIAHTDRFRAAVSINGIANQLTWQLTSDTGSFFYAGAFGDPFASDENLARAWQRSPLAYSARIRTPLLLLQSEDDYRCPIDQGEELFGALAARGATVELIRFPNAAHDLNGSAAPVHAYLAQCLTLEWFERFIGI